MADKIVYADQVEVLEIRLKTPLFFGDVLEADFQLLDTNGAAIALAGWRWVFGIKKRGRVAELYKDTAAVADANKFLISGSTAQLRLSSADTASLEELGEGEFEADIQVMNADDKPFPFAHALLPFKKAVSKFR